MAQSVSSQVYFKIIYLYHLKNTLNTLVALLELISVKLMESQKKILII